MAIQLATTIAELKASSAVLMASKGAASLGLVPTMGALHSGHAQLAQAAVDANDVVVASIFVNPLQFGEALDLERYPRTLEADLALLEEQGVDLVFAPSVAQMYPGRPAGRPDHRGRARGQVRGCRPARDTSTAH